MSAVDLKRHEESLVDAHELLIEEHEILEREYDQLKLAKIRSEESLRSTIKELRRQLAAAIIEIEELQLLLERSYLK